METFETLTDAYGEEILKIHLVLKGTHFLSVEDVKAKMTEILNSLSENDLWNSFERWQHRTQLFKGTVVKNYLFPNDCMIPEHDAPETVKQACINWLFENEEMGIKKEISELMGVLQLWKTDFA